MWPLLPFMAESSFIKISFSKLYFKRDPAQHRIEALACLGKGEFEAFSSFFSSYLMFRDMSNVPGYQKNEHCIQPWFSLVE